MKIKSVLFIFLFISLTNSVFSQKKITWKDVVEIYAKEFRLKEKNPTSTLNTKTMSLKDVENKKVKIRGYFLDIDPDGNWYVLSKNPFATCFFCGKSGPETILELISYKNVKKKFKSDDLVEVTGFFNIVYDPEDKMSFVIEKASIKHINN
ncbi:MAG: hypothetical protein P8I51_04000 [Polaribacter sp.]|jgi:hypothetical protein|nr:hypothetical protein [Polaribacter sp.]MDG1954041.1 hypothetical protein [Polaribacter sp.]MDG2074714.1 hypothetical protein [Polaribacter sp.]